MFILVGAAACAAPVFWYGVIPYPWTLAGTNPERTALMEQRVQDARNQDAPFELRQEWARLDEISPNLVRAVLTAEDYRFREHRGIDWVSLAEEVHWTGDISRTAPPNRIGESGRSGLAQESTRAP